MTTALATILSVACDPRYIVLEDTPEATGWFHTAGSIVRNLNDRLSNPDDSFALSEACFLGDKLIEWKGRHWRLFNVIDQPHPDTTLPTDIFLTDRSDMDCELYELSSPHTAEAKHVMLNGHMKNVRNDTIKRLVELDAPTVLIINAAARGVSFDGLYNDDTRRCYVARQIKWADV